MAGATFTWRCVLCGRYFRRHGTELADVRALARHYRVCRARALSLSKDEAPGHGTRGSGSGSDGVQPAASSSTRQDRPAEQPATISDPQSES